MSHARTRLAAALTFSAAMALLPVVAWAHEEVESGSYVFEIGWVVEPVIVGERNGIDLFVARHDDPETGISDISTLQFTVEYGGASQAYELVGDHDDAGHYTAEFIPTVEGQYTFHLSGTIEDEAVDVSVEPEEVVAAGSLEFPPSTAAVADSSTRTLAIAGVVLGLCGVGLGVYGLTKRR
jgi:hypothetical protein